MPKKPQFKSDAFEAIHCGVKGLFNAGGIDKTTMREFYESCLSMPMQKESKQDALIEPASLK